jgi:two-component system response regulator YesN
LTTLFNAVTAYDVEEIEVSLAKLFSFISGLKDKMVVYNFLVNALFEFETKLSSMNESLCQIIGDKIQCFNELLQFETMEELQAWLTEKMYKVAESLYKKKQRPNYKLIAEVIEYIEDNLAERLTLQDVADHFAFSPNYLGFIFKEETNENFSSFLINRRIEKACELLRDTRMRVYEVADAVGYKNLTYFSRQFKENTGLTPGDYRKECGVQEI